MDEVPGSSSTQSSPPTVIAFETFFRLFTSWLLLSSEEASLLMFSPFSASSTPETSVFLSMVLCPPVLETVDEVAFVLLSSLSPPCFSISFCRYSPCFSICSWSFLWFCNKKPCIITARENGTCGSLSSNEDFLLCLKIWLAWIPSWSPQAVHGVAFELPLAGAMLQWCSCPCEHNQETTGQYQHCYKSMHWAKHHENIDTSRNRIYTKHSIYFKI